MVRTRDDGALTREDYEALKGVSFWDFLQKDYPELNGKLHTSGNYSKEVPCPFCGGHTKFRWRAGKDGGPEMAFCNTCGGMSIIGYVKKRHHKSTDKEAADWILQRPPDWRNSQQRQVVARPETPLDMRIAKAHHEVKGGWRNYFYWRFITDATIDRYRLGWNERLHRYSIPCFQKNPTTGQMELHGVQYRITPEDYREKVAAGEKPAKYTSEYGSHNHRLFNSYRVAGRELPYVLVLEGPLDVLSAASWNLPAVATFQGNNKSKPWDDDWNQFLHGALSVLVVPDEDASGAGADFAVTKMKQIPHAKIHPLPKVRGRKVKDFGDLLHAFVECGLGADEVQIELTLWLEGRKLVPDY